MNDKADDQLIRAFGLISLICLGLVLLGAAIELPAALGGTFFSDCASYYALASSIAFDLDIEYRREDLQRIYADFSGGPSGVFLQRNPDGGALFYGKAYIYPLLLAPAVRLVGARAVLVTHAFLFSWLLLIMTLLFERHAGALRALATALAFVLPTAATAYYFWVAPEFFNLTLIFTAYFFWLYKDFNPRAEDERPPRWRAALLSPWTDLAALALLGLATYSKLSNGALILPPLVYMFIRKRWLRLLGAVAMFALAAALTFGVQLHQTGNWNYQGGDRKSFHGEFPLANGKTFDTASEVAQVTDLGEYRPPFYPADIAHNYLYFFLGRFGGIVPYFFPAVLAMVMFLILDRRSLLRWIVLVGALAAASVYIVLIPTNAIGGGGTVANRYFMNVFPLFFFLLPARAPRWTPAAAVLGGVLMTGPILADPIGASRFPSRYAETPLHKLLPVELTMLNDLPIRTERDRARMPWYRVRGGQPVRGDDGELVIDFYLYQLDHNSYTKEPNPHSYFEGENGRLTRRLVTERGRQVLWTIGGRSAELILRTGSVAKRITLLMTNSACENDVTVTLQGLSESFHLEPGEQKRLDFDTGRPFAYHYLSTSYLYPLVVSTSNGVTPRTTAGGQNDWRHLGVMLEFLLE